MDAEKYGMDYVGANLRVRPVVRKNCENQDLHDCQDKPDFKTSRGTLHVPCETEQTINSKDKKIERGKIKFYGGV